LHGSQPGFRIRLLRNVKRIRATEWLRTFNTVGPIVVDNLTKVGPPAYGCVLLKSFIDFPRVRDDDRKAKALEQGEGHIGRRRPTPNDLGRAKLKPNKGPSYKGGHTYQHPDDKTLVWLAKGQKPKWLRELEASGEKPNELLVGDRKPG